MGRDQMTKLIKMSFFLGLSTNEQIYMVHCCFFCHFIKYNRVFFHSYIVKFYLSFFLFRPSSSSFRREVVQIPKVLLVNLVLVFTLPSWLPTRSKCTQSLVFQAALATVGHLMGKDCSVFLVPCFFIHLFIH